MPTIQLTQNQQTNVSEEDYAYLLQWRWHVTSHGYAGRNARKNDLPDAPKTMKMHRVIVERMTGEEIPEGYEVDHINMDRLDNRRENLRLATKGQNAMNRDRRWRRQGQPKSSQYKGVRWHDAGKWQAYIWFDKKTFPLGLYMNEKEAAEAYDAKAKEVFGEYAKLNFPE